MVSSASLWPAFISSYVLTTCRGIALHRLTDDLRLLAVAQALMLLDSSSFVSNVIASSHTPRISETYAFGFT